MRATNIVTFAKNTSLPIHVHHLHVHKNEVYEEWASFKINKLGQRTLLVRVLSIDIGAPRMKQKA